MTRPVAGDLVAAQARLVAAGLFPVAATVPTYPVSRELLPPFSSAARYIWPPAPVAL